MKNLILMITFGIFFMPAIAGGPSFNQKLRERNIQYLRVYNHEIKNGKATSNRYLEELIEYDTHGNGIYQKFFKGPDDLAWILRFIPDSLENVNTTIQKAADGRIVSIFHHKYNDDLKPVLRHSYRAPDGQLTQVDTYEYDSNGNLVNETSYNARGEIIQQTLKTFDRNGDPLEVVTLDRGMVETQRRVQERRQDGFWQYRVYSDGLYDHTHTKHIYENVETLEWFNSENPAAPIRKQVSLLDEWDFRTAIMIYQGNRLVEYKEMEWIARTY